MKKTLAFISLVSITLSSCNHHPTNEAAETKKMDSEYVETPGLGAGNDSLIINEPIVRSLKHYFSDSALMDSFVVELPIGNIFTNRLLIKIYNSNNELIYIDSMSGFSLLKTTSYNQGQLVPEMALHDIHESINHWYNVDNFSQAGEVDAIKNANAQQISNMVGWNEAMADTTKMVYNFYDKYEGTYYVTYSQKLKRGVVIVKVPAETEDKD